MGGGGRDQSPVLVSVLRMWGLSFRRVVCESLCRTLCDARLSLREDGVALVG